MLEGIENILNVCLNESRIILYLFDETCKKLLDRLTIDLNRFV